MKKIVVSAVLLVSVFLNVAESSARPKHKAMQSNAALRCGEWQPITGQNGAVIGEWRECTNIFGRHRVEIVTFH
jgi:hypothetical protein